MFYTVLNVEKNERILKLKLTMLISVQAEKKNKIYRSKHYIVCVRMLTCLLNRTWIYNVMCCSLVYIQ